MKIDVIKTSGEEIAMVRSDEPVITDAQSAMDFIATVSHETGCRAIALNKSAIIEEFFDLSTGIAGEVLQKFVNYHIKFAIVGDFPEASKSLRDFIYESNNGRHLFFVSTEQQAVDKLSEH